MWSNIVGILGIVMIMFIVMAIMAKRKKTGKTKKWIFYAVGCFLLAMVSNSFVSAQKQETAASASSNASKSTDAVKETAAPVQKSADAKQNQADAQKAAQEKAKHEAEAAAKKKADEEVKAQADAAAKKAAEEKANEIQPGTYEVGKDVQPGLYRTDGDISYFARLKGLSGDLSDILANGNPTGPDVIQILPTDKGFETQGSGFWYKIDDTYKPQIQTSFGDGTYIVGKDILPGTYKSTGGDIGYWARLSGFTGDLSEVLANANPQGSTIVDIKPTDKGFQTSGNGTWTKVQ